MKKPALLAAAAIALAGAAAASYYRLARRAPARKAPRVVCADGQPAPVDLVLLEHSEFGRPDVSVELIGPDHPSMPPPDGSKPKGKVKVKIVVHDDGKKAEAAVCLPSDWRKIEYRYLVRALAVTFLESRINELRDRDDLADERRTLTRTRRKIER